MLGLQMSASTMLLELQDGAWTIDKRFYYVASTKGGYQDYRWLLGLLMGARTTDVARNIERIFKSPELLALCLGLGQAKLVSQDP